MNAPVENHPRRAALLAATAEKPRYRVNDDATLTHISGAVPVIDVNQLAPAAYAGQQSQAGWEHSIYDGSKFAGGFGPTQLQSLDYWTMRARSDQLFNENLYARGLIRRLVTNEINTGLTPEASPDPGITGMTAEQLNEWSERVETRFDLWGKNPNICDWRGEMTFGALQRAARAEALISGDVLVVMPVSQQTKLARIQLIRGSSVQTPLLGGTDLRKGHRIEHGVELNPSNRVVAYWIRQQDGTSKRLAATGERSGRRLAWLVFGTDKRLDDVRGQPLLGLVMQSLKEIDRYRDSTQRKAVINSILAMFIKKTEDKPGTLPMQGGAVRRDRIATADDSPTSRTFESDAFIPGIVMQELQVGEEPVPMSSQGIDEKFGDFEQAIIQAIAWANEIPPEILTLAFSNNYSASQAAINEFKIYLNKVWTEFGEQFCQPVYTSWLISETLLQRIQADGLLEAWRDPLQYEVFGTWTAALWYGSIKPSTDMLKQVKASDLLVAGAYSTHAREARVTTGTKWARNVATVKIENQLLAEAMRPILQLEKEFGEERTRSVATAIAAVGNDVTELIEVIDSGDRTGSSN